MFSRLRCKFRPQCFCFVAAILNLGEYFRAQEARRAAAEQANAEAADRAREIFQDKMGIVDVETNNNNNNGLFNLNKLEAGVAMIIVLLMAAWCFWKAFQVRLAAWRAGIIAAAAPPTNHEPAQGAPAVAAAPPQPAPAPAAVPPYNPSAPPQVQVVPYPYPQASFQTDPHAGTSKGRSKRGRRASDYSDID